MKVKISNVKKIQAAMLVVMSELNKVNTAIIKSSCGRVF